MAQLQPEVAGNVVAFPQRKIRRAVSSMFCLTPLDRVDVTVWQDRARLAGYDRMVIHDRDDGDAAEVGEFLSVYRRGDAWSRWGFARVGLAVRAWCCLTGADMGEFDTLGDAFTAVLHRAGAFKARRRKVARTMTSVAVVTRIDRSLGSAA